MIRGGRGFTLVESMIFLAVTGALFTSAILLMSGQQRKGQFTQATRDFETKIRDIMNDINTGYYGQQSYNCNYGPTFAASGSINQGGNKDCIFAGKVIHFGGCATCASDYHVYTLVGNRTTASGSNNEVTSLKSSNPKVVDGSRNSPNAAAPTLTENLTIPYGIEILSARSGGTFVNAVGFTSTFSGFINADDTSSFEIKKFNAAGLSGVTGTSQTTVISAINGVGAAADNTVAIDIGSNPIVLCVGSINDENFARIEIGGNRNNGVTLTVVKNYNAATGDCT